MAKNNHTSSLIFLSVIWVTLAYFIFLSVTESLSKLEQNFHNMQIQLEQIQEF